MNDNTFKNNWLRLKSNDPIMKLFGITTYTGEVILFNKKFSIYSLEELRYFREHEIEKMKVCDMFYFNAQDFFSDEFLNSIPYRSF